MRAVRARVADYVRMTLPERLGVQRCLWVSERRENGMLRQEVTSAVTGRKRVKVQAFVGWQKAYRKAD